MRVYPFFSDRPNSIPTTGFHSSTWADTTIRGPITNLSATLRKRGNASLKVSTSIRDLTKPEWHSAISIENRLGVKNNNINLC